MTQRPSTLLSHVNLLAKGWGIPNAYVRDAQAALRQYDGQWVELNVSAQDYRVQPMARPDVVPRHAAQAGRAQAAQAGPVGDRAETAVRPESPRQPLLWRQGRQSGRAQVRPAARRPRAGRLLRALLAIRGLHATPAGGAEDRGAGTAPRFPDRRQRATRSLGGAAGRDRRRRTGRGAGAILAGAVEQPAQGSGRVRAQLIEFGRPARLQRRRPVHHGAQRDPGRGAGARVQTVWASVYNFEAYEARRAGWARTPWRWRCWCSWRRHRTARA